MIHPGKSTLRYLGIQGQMMSFGNLKLKTGMPAKNPSVQHQQHSKPIPSTEVPFIIRVLESPREMPQPKVEF